MRISSNRRSLALAGCSVVLATSCALSPTGLNVGEQPDAPDSAGSVAPQRSPPASTAGSLADGAAGASGPTPDAGLAVAMADAAASGSQSDGSLPPVTPDGTPAAVVSPDAAQPPDGAPSIIRAHKITADRIVAGVVYARRIEAKTGMIGQAEDPLPDATLAAQIGRMDLKVSELIVDVLYAQDIQAGRVEIVEAHATALRIDKPDP